MKLPLDRAAIEEILPHRDPFLLIDEVLELAPGERVVARKAVTDEDCAGHFPGNPIMPGVLLIEAMAQTAAALVIGHLGERKEGNLVYFMSIDKARFRRPVLPGHVVRFPVRLLHKRAPVWRYSAEAQVDGVKFAEAEIGAMLIDKRAG